MSIFFFPPRFLLEVDSVHNFAVGYWCLFQHDLHSLDQFLHFEAVLHLSPKSCIFLIFFLRFFFWASPAHPFLKPVPTAWSQHSHSPGCSHITDVEKGYTSVCLLSPFWTFHNAELDKFASIFPRYEGKESYPPKIDPPPGWSSKKSQNKNTQNKTPLKRRGRGSFYLKKNTKIPKPQSRTQKWWNFKKLRILKSKKHG